MQNTDPQSDITHLRKPKFIHIAEAIGFFCFYWNKLEFDIENLLIKCIRNGSKIDPNSPLKIDYADLSKRIKFLRTYHAVDFPENNIDGRFMNILSEVDELIVIRNQLIHDYWIENECGFIQRSRSKSSYKDIENKVRITIGGHREVYPKQVWDLILRIDDVRKKIITLNNLFPE